MRKVENLDIAGIAGPRAPIPPIINASTTNCEVMPSCIDQPTMLREYRSSTAAT